MVAYSHHFDEKQDCRICNRTKVKRGIRICINMMRIRNTGRFQSRYVGKSLLAAKQKTALSLVEFSCGSATLDAPQRRYVGKSLLAAQKKATLSFVEFSCGSATLYTSSADMYVHVNPYWLLSEKSHSHWLNCRAGTS